MHVRSAVGCAADLFEVLAAASSESCSAERTPNCVLCQVAGGTFSSVVNKRQKKKQVHAC